MKLATARDAVYLRTGFESTDGQLTPQRVTDCLRTALRFIANDTEGDWLQTSETLSTTSGTNYVTPLAGSASTVQWTKTLHLTGPNQDTLEQRPYSQFRYQAQASTGQPNEWSLYQGRLYLWPVPDAVYALRHDFIRAEPALSQDTDSPLLPDQFCDAWVEKACELAYRRVHDSSSAEECHQKYSDWLRILADDRRQSAGPRRISIRPGSWI